MINKYSNSDKQVLNKHSNNSNKQVGLYLGGLTFYIRGAPEIIWNEVSISTHGGLTVYTGVGVIFGGGSYIRRFMVYPACTIHTLH